MAKKFTSGLKFQKYTLKIKSNSVNVWLSIRECVGEILNNGTCDDQCCKFK